MQELKLGAPLKVILEFSDGLTRGRNERNFHTIADRVDHLALGGGELLKSVHVGDTGILPSVSAKIALRIFTVLQGLGAMDDIIQTLMDKFPESGCSYRGNKPCSCAVDRPQTKTSVFPSELQREWSLSEWQKHLKDVYGASNKEKGALLWAASRLSSEIKEVLEARMRMDREKSPELIEKYKRETISELADSFAWVCAVCNELDANLDSEFVKRYGKGCEHCGQYPCACGAFDWKDERTKVAE